MITRRSLSLSLIATLLTVGAGVSLAPVLYGAEEPAAQHLSAQLIWGTDGSKPADKEKDLKAISPELGKRLRRIFKWKNYFEVSRTNFVVTPGKTSQVGMSRECRLEVAPQTNGEVEIQLIGKGAPVVRKRQRLLPGETVVLAGDDKDDNAWFVVVTPHRPGEADH